MLKAVYYLDAQTNSLSEDVMKDVKQLWRDFEFGNDHYYAVWEGKYWDFCEDYPHLHAYLLNNVPDGYEALVRYWW